jgi:hypothetical protein
VKSSAAEVALVAVGVVTTTLTTPAACAGEPARIWVAELTTYDVAATVPNSTALAPRNPVPVMVTALVPVRGPATGLTALTIGTAW